MLRGRTLRSQEDVGFRSATRDNPYHRTLPDDQTRSRRWNGQIEKRKYEVQRGACCLIAVSRSCTSSRHLFNFKLLVEADQLHCQLTTLLIHDMPASWQWHALITSNTLASFGRDVGKTPRVLEKYEPERRLWLSQGSVAVKARKFCRPINCHQSTVFRHSRPLYLITEPPQSHSSLCAFTQMRLVRRLIT